MEKVKKLQPMFLVDESSGRKLFNFLIKQDFDVKFVTDEIPGASDGEVLQLAEKEHRILIANDKDFGELIFRLNKPSSGVILLRVRADSTTNRQKHIDDIIKNFKNKLISNFIIVTEGKIRIKEI